MATTPATSEVNSGTVSGRIERFIYDDAVVRADSQSAANPAALLTAINAIHTAGSTNLHLGWLPGAERIAPEVDRGSMSRVILLSDGMANRGLLEPDKIYEQCRDLANAGVTTSTYGLGDHFDERLMTGMARAGLGNAYYGQSADDLMDPFQEEIAYLSNICARKVRGPAFEPAVGFTAPVAVEIGRASCRERV